jgi:hypothetical protein
LVWTSGWNADMLDKQRWRRGGAAQRGGRKANWQGYSSNYINDTSLLTFARLSTSDFCIWVSLSKNRYV